MCLPAFLCAAAAVLGLAGPSKAGYRDTSQKIGVVVILDLDRYLGTWCEIARCPDRFDVAAPG